MTEYGVVLVFFLLGLVFAATPILISLIFAPRSPNVGEKLNAYECGEPIIGDARIQFRVGFYLIALMFLIFDIEALFLFPAIAILREASQGGIAGISGSLILAEIGIFVGILVFGVLYAWRKKVVNWE